MASPLSNGSIINTILLIIVSACISCAIPNPTQSSSPPEQKSKPSLSVAALEKTIHALINKERLVNGLNQITWDDALSEIARKHSRDMSKRNYFDHYSPEGHDYLYRYEQEGYQCAIVEGRIVHLGAENIALNYLYDKVTTINGEAFYDWNSQDKIAETTVQGWMRSIGHRKNILTPYFQKEGIGVVISPDDKIYITQNFC